MCESIGKYEKAGSLSIYIYETYTHIHIQVNQRIQTHEFTNTSKHVEFETK